MGEERRGYAYLASTDIITPITAGVDDGQRRPASDGRRSPVALAILLAVLLALPSAALIALLALGQTANAQAIDAMASVATDGAGGQTEHTAWYADTTTPVDEGFSAHPTDGGESDRQATDGDGGDAAEPTFPPADATLGEEIAWLAVQMAGVATPSAGTNGVSLYAPGADPWTKIDDDRLAVEFAIMDATLGEYDGNNAYASCNQAACGVLAAVVDMDMIPYEEASGNPAHMLAYLSAHPETWEQVDASSTDDLLPGDVLVHGGHTAIYVGLDAAREKFPGTDCDVYQAGYQEGHHARYPELNDGGYDGAYSVFRARRRNTGAAYPQVDYRAIVADVLGR